jgi:WhiB family redox-sensing transcriptional regulator
VSNDFAPFSSRHWKDRPSSFVVTAPSWHARASCAGVDTAVFFPDEPGENKVRYDVAKAFCALCPVVAACREWALAEMPSDGVFGGLTPLERRRARRQRRAS